MEENVQHKEESRNMTPNKSAVHLWEFLLELLADESCSSLIHWTKKEEREFKLKNQEEVARRWGNLKQRPGMNYDKLSRALRYYYQKNIIRKVSGQRLVYKFVELPYNYRPVKRWTQESGWVEKDQEDSTSSDLIDLPAVNRKVTKPSLKPLPLSSAESLVYEEFKVIQEPLRARCERCVTSESRRCQCPTVRRVIVAKPVPVIQTCGHAKSLPSLSY